MKSFLTSLFIVVFLSVGVLSYIAMNRDYILSTSHGGKCLAERLEGSFCPNAGNDSFGFASFHLNAFKQFSLAFLFEPLMIFILGFALTLLISILHIKNNILLSPIASFASHRSSRNTVALRKVRFARWLAFHENSPSSD